MGDEGGFAPDLESNEAALEALVSGIEAAGYAPGEDVAIALDPATSELFDDGAYVLEHEGRTLSAGRAGRLLGGRGRRATRSSRSRTAWTRRTGTAGSALTDRIGDRVQLVGDDLFVTNTERLRRGIDSGVANSILVKVNQIGTLTETLDAVRTATEAGYTAVMSHRSGETEDTTIADLAVATGCGQIKTGAPSRSDRVAKYNQLLRIEEALGADATYPGPSRIPVELGAHCAGGRNPAAAAKGCPNGLAAQPEHGRAASARDPLGPGRADRPAHDACGDPRASTCRRPGTGSSSRARPASRRGSCRR